MGLGKLQSSRPKCLIMFAFSTSHRPPNRIKCWESVEQLCDCKLYRKLSVFIVGALANWMIDCRFWGWEWVRERERERRSGLHVSIFDNYVTELVDGGSNEGSDCYLEDKIIIQITRVIWMFNIRSSIEHDNEFNIELMGGKSGG